MLNSKSSTLCLPVCTQTVEQYPQPNGHPEWQLQKLEDFSGVEQRVVASAALSPSPCGSYSNRLD